jgi:hypothetical protein
MTTSPLARGVRTFLAALAGYAGTWAALNWTDDPVRSGQLLGLNIATALVAAIAAYFLAVGGASASTAVGKAFATFAQVVGSGIAALAFNTVADITANGRVILTTVIAAVFAAVGTLATNAAEGAPIAKE